MPLPRWLALLCSLTLSLAGGFGTAAAQSRPIYDLAVDTYRAGRAEEAWRILAKLEESQVWAEANRFWQTPRDQPD